jgi:hypothetical protein
MGQDLCKCGTETYLEIMNNWWTSINIRSKELKDFVNFIKQISEQLKSGKINIEIFLRMIIHELLMNGQLSSKAVFRDFFVSNFTHLREVILSLIFLCQPTDYIDYIRKCFTEIDDILFDSFSKEVKTKDFDIASFHKNLENHNSIPEYEDLSLLNTKNQSNIEKYINEPISSAMKKETGYFVRVKENSLKQSNDENILEKKESVEKEKEKVSNAVKKREENKQSDMEQNDKVKEEKSEGKELREKSDRENKAKLYSQNQSPMKVRKESIEIKPLEKVVCTKVKKEAEVFLKFTYKVEGIYFINRQSLSNIIRLYIKLITGHSMTYIFKENEKSSVADKENASSYYISFNEESQERLLDSIMNLWGCEDIFLDDFLNSRYNSLINDQQVRDSLFNQLY